MFDQISKEDEARQCLEVLVSCSDKKAKLNKAISPCSLYQATILRRKKNEIETILIAANSSFYTPGKNVAEIVELSTYRNLELFLFSWKSIVKLLYVLNNTLLRPNELFESN